MGDSINPNEGCTFGKLLSQEVHQMDKRIENLEGKFWTILVLGIGTFGGVIANLIIK